MVFARGFAVFAIVLVGCESATSGASAGATAPSAPAASAVPAAAAAMGVSGLPPVAMPSPSSVTLDEPGGDAPDKELAALMRLTNASDIGTRGDKWGTMKVGQIDPNHWKRASIFGTPTRITFTYGDANHAVSAVIYEPSDGPSDPRSCLAKFMRFANDMAQAYDIEYEMSPVHDAEQTTDGVRRPMAEVMVEGKVNSPFMANSYSAAVVAYQSFPGTCLVQSFAAVATRHPEVARKVRDTWLASAAPIWFWNPKTITDKAPPFDAL